MDRRKAIQLLASSPLAMITLRSFMDRPSDPSARMPVLFLGHGSPMNAIEDNPFTQGWRAMGRELPKPTAILCISAHWETNGTFVTAMEHPRTIHDFGGFPQALFDVQYPAPGSPALARDAQQVVTSRHIAEDHAWGLDHGAWSVITHLFPEADVPVVQLSLDRGMAPQQHMELAQELSVLRDQGVLIIGSGNMVHNLRMVDWNNPDGGYDWAVEANEQFKATILRGDNKELADYAQRGRAIQLSVPTPEHYLPLLYAMGLSKGNQEVRVFNDRTIMGSISMTSLKIG
ncbi:MAG: 4,5-DOPA dioxygenase extradiol [Flavobacteriales bacterium]